MEAGEYRETGYDVSKQAARHNKCGRMEERGGEYDEYKNDLQRSRQLPINGRRKRAITGGQQDHRRRSENQDVAPQHKNSEPPPDLPIQCEHDEGGGEQKLIGNGIKIGAQARFLVQGTRQQAIHAVGQGRKDQDAKRPGITPVKDQNNEERKEPQTQQGKLVRNGKNAPG